MVTKATFDTGITNKLSGLEEGRDRRLQIVAAHHRHLGDRQCALQESFKQVLGVQQGVRIPRRGRLQAYARDLGS